MTLACWLLLDDPVFASAITSIAVVGFIGLAVAALLHERGYGPVKPATLGFFASDVVMIYAATQTATDARSAVRNGLKSRCDAKTIG